MNRGAPSTSWLMPWLAPVVLGALYVAELWREGLATDPLMLLIRAAFGAPLVVAGSLLLAVAEQLGRAGALTPRLRRWLVWTPRVLLLLFVALLALLSLDVIEEGLGAGEIALGLLVHNLPTLGLLAVTAAAWRWPWVGAVGIAGFAAWWLLFFGGRGFGPSAFLLMVGLPLTVGALFLLSWWVAGPPHRPAAG